MVWALQKAARNNRSDTNVKAIHNTWTQYCSTRVSQTFQRLTVMWTCIAVYVNIAWYMVHASPTIVVVSALFW